VAPPRGEELPLALPGEHGRLGDFRILREVGRGGMGVVYEAEQISLGRRVALKVLPFAATMDPRHLQRFHNEARAAAGLHHTSIVPVYGVGCDRSVHFYAMQFIEGQTLAALIADLRQRGGQSPLPADQPTTPHVPGAPAAETVERAATSTERPAQDSAYFLRVAEWGIQAAEALDYAHQMGVVHRDVKPANLLLDAAGRLWVTDFGLAQAQSHVRLTQTGDLVGTLRYMSPEQALAKRVVIDHRTDVYSLGATLYELLTLRPAYSGNDRQELLRQIAFEEPARLRRLNRAIPAELEIIVLKALEKNPKDRYATAQELADDLERYRRDEPIRGRRPSLMRRAQKWARRHRPLVAGVGAAMLMGLAVLAGSIGWVARDQSARRAASEPIVRSALADVDFWQGKGRLPEALSAAQRANGLLAGADVDDALRQQVRARLADLQLLEQLENVRLGTATGVTGGHFDDERGNALYGRILREAGLDVEALSPEEAGERIARSTVAVELAALLDYWSLTYRKLGEEDEPRSKHLLRVARVADPDPGRARVRELWERWDPPALRALAASEDTLRLPPATLAAVGRALIPDKEGRKPAEAFLRAALRLHPDDFWLNHNLFLFLRALPPPEREEAYTFAAVEVALRPDSPGAHGNLGNVLHDMGRLDEAIAQHREALRLSPNDHLGHTNLGLVLAAKDLLDEAEAEHRVAIRLKPTDPLAYHNLGNVLNRKGLHEEAIAEFRRALELSKETSEETPAHKEDFSDELRARAHFSLGNAHRQLGHLDDEAEELRAALRIKKDWAQAHCNLGRTLQRLGRFAEALAHLRRGDELGSKDPQHWRYPSKQWVKECELLIELDAKLPRVLKGEVQPVDVGERVGLAQLCQQPYKALYAAACRLYSDAFAEEPRLADDLQHQLRYGAARAAALAGCGRGNDADRSDERERVRLRRQALDWLRADLAVYRGDLEKVPDKAAPEIRKRMQHWQQDKDFAGVRNAKGLDRLPEAERAAWQELWREVTDLLTRAEEKTTPEKKAVTD
jgi:serine/threonine protein kinase/Tfp pilus assembly protein PilF